MLPLYILEILLPSNSLLLKGPILESEEIFIGLANMSVKAEELLAQVCTASISPTSRADGESVYNGTQLKFFFASYKINYIAARHHRTRPVLITF